MARRDEIVVATKTFFPWRNSPNTGFLSRKAIFQSIDDSLMRLGMDYVDLFQIHRFDYSTPVEETMEALHDVVKAGKARYIGASSMEAWRFAKMQHTAERNGWTRFITMQPQYNLLYREEEREMLPLCEDQGVGVIPWSPMARGRLTRDWSVTSRPIGAPVTACAAGAQAIGDAARMIRSGEADIALCGGAEAAIHRVSLAGFAAARALSSAYSDQPESASRPFDRDRDGFVMGEGAGLIVIESLEHALARGATPLAELVGYGTSADAYHLTAGPEDGNGARRAMEIAIRQAGVTVDEIDHINAHATSTQVGDKGELAAIKTLFGAHPVAITSTKSATGHLLGAAGGIEAIFTIQALRDQVVPPTLNLHHPDEDAAGMNLVALQARPQKMRYALSNGFGFGGVNASLLLKRWQ